MEEKKQNIDLKAKTKWKLQDTNINIECELNNRLSYQAETNEQNSGENWSAGAEGGGFSTIASKSS